MGTVYRRTPKGKYYGVYTDAHGNRIRKSTGTTNKQDATRIVAKWEADENDQRHGLAPTGNVPLNTLIVEYLDYLGNTGDVHRDKTEARIRRIVDACGWTKAQQVNQYQVETTARALVSLRNGKKLSLRTQAHYLTSIKSFTRWLTVVRHALPRDPLSAVRKPNFAADRKLIRRFLLPEEWPWIAKTAHAVLYQTAIETGFRAGEIRHVSREHIAADHIHLPAKYTKNKQPAKQYITADLRAKLDTIQVPFIVRDDDRMAELVREDLIIARDLYVASLPKGKQPAPYFLTPVNALGHILDFHAMRHTCGAWLASSGVNAKVIQSVMRHSSITLTLDTYGHLMPGAEQDAVQHFARIMALDLCHDSGT